VSNASKGTPAPGPGKQVPFEEAMKKLEAVVEAMESGELPLESLLSKFEEGARLVQACQAKLEEAELKINQLEKDAAGKTQLQPASESLLENE
jgi:exodeoxyribonuclease VII small subunit